MNTVKTYREGLKARGLCVSCRDPVVFGCIRCASCLKYIREYKAAQRSKQRIVREAVKCAKLLVTDLRCPSCKLVKPKTEFYASKSRSTGVQWQCKDCAKARQKRRHTESPDWFYFAKLLREFGMTRNDYAVLFNNQDRSCAICKIKPEEKLCVDHDHSTGKVRGLLCDRCNHMLGNARDRKDILVNAISYLEGASF